MKKLFAYAAMALAALILTTHSDAKPGGSVHPHMALHHHFAHPHHFAHMHDFDHHHRFARRFEFGFPGFVEFGAPYAEPLIVEVPKGSDDVTGSTEPRRVSVRGNGPQGCSTQNVTVPSSQGGETTVHVIRC